MNPPEGIVVSCARCGKFLRAPLKLRGRRVKCPACSNVVQVPGAPGASGGKKAGTKPAPAPPGAKPARRKWIWIAAGATILLVAAAAAAVLFNKAYHRAGETRLYVHFKNCAMSRQITAERCHALSQKTRATGVTEFNEKQPPDLVGDWNSVGHDLRGYQISSAVDRVFDKRSPPREGEEPSTDKILQEYESGRCLLRSLELYTDALSADSQGRIHIDAEKLQAADLEFERADQLFKQNK